MTTPYIFHLTAAGHTAVLEAMHTAMLSRGQEFSPFVGKEQYEVAAALAHHECRIREVGYEINLPNWKVRSAVIDLLKNKWARSKW